MSPHSALRTPRFSPRFLLLGLLSLALLFALARAIQTPEVEIGNAGAYDGTVKIRRDASGRLIFSDNQVTSPVALNDLRYAGRDHGLLLGLLDDDHPQYFNAARFAPAHAGAHTAAFNGALATPPDVHGNATLAAHLADAAVHLNRSAAESISGNWIFSGAPSFTGSGGLTVKSPDATKSAGLSTDNSGTTVLSSANGILRFYSNGYSWFSTSANQDFYVDCGGLFKFRDVDGSYATRLSIDSSTGDINNISGTYKTNGTTRLAADGSAVLTQADVDNLRLDGNCLSSTNTNGDLSLTPNGTGKVIVTGELSVNSGAGKITLNGQRFINEINLLDNPDFTLWQRGTGTLYFYGGNAAGTITWPVPGTMTTCADRWQVSRARTDTVTTISRALPPAPLPTALNCLKNEVVSGAAARQYIHQTLPRELTAGLRGKWVTFAVSHYINGTTGGTIGLYKVVGGIPSALALYNFTSAANTWERVALTAQVPADAEVLLVSVVSNLAAGGPTAAYLANAVLVEGKYVSTTEKVSDPTLSSVPPLARRPADDLAACQRYFERGSFIFSASAPDASLYDYATSVHFNTAKAASPMIELTNLVTEPLINPDYSTAPQPPYSPGVAYPHGFRFSISGSAGNTTAFSIFADWSATCPEPI